MSKTRKWVKMVRNGRVYDFCCTGNEEQRWQVYIDGKEQQTLTYQELIKYIQSI